MSTVSRLSNPNISLRLGGLGSGELDRLTQLIQADADRSELAQLRRDKLQLQQRVNVSVQAGVWQEG